MYYPPDDVHAWYNNFRHLFASNLQDDDAMLAWALACTPSAASDYLLAEMNAAATRWSLKLSDCGIKSNDLYVPQMEAVRLSLSGNQGTIETVQRMRQFFLDHERILNTIQRIDRDYAIWGRSDYLRELSIRLSQRSGKTALKSYKKGYHSSPPQTLPAPSLSYTTPVTRDTILLPCGVLVAGADLVTMKLLNILNESLMLITTKTKFKPIYLINFLSDNHFDGYAKVDDHFGAVAISLPKVWESGVELACAQEIEFSLDYTVWLKLLIIPLIAIHLCGASRCNNVYYKSFPNKDEHTLSIELTRDLISIISCKVDFEPPNMRHDPFFKIFVNKLSVNSEIPSWLNIAIQYFKNKSEEANSNSIHCLTNQQTFNNFLVKDSKKWMSLF
jgi:hypothetical protein